MKKILLLLLLIHSTIHSQEAKIYISGGAIQSLSLNGTDRKVIIAAFGNPAGVSFYNDKCYVSDENGISRNYRFNPDGSSPEIVHDGLDGIINPVSVFGYNNELYFLDREFIRKSDINGNNVVTLISAISAGSDSKVVVANNKIYWTSVNTLNCANLDGTNQQVLTDEGDIYGGLWVEGNNIYWIVSTNGGASSIKKAPLDFSSETILLSSAISPTSIGDLTVLDGKLYWTDTFLDKIMRSNLDGTNVQVVYSILGLANPSGIAGYNGYIYWTDSYVQNNKLHRISTSLTNYQIVIGANFSGSQYVNADGGELFFSGNFIKKINLNTNNISTLTTNTGGFFNSNFEFNNLGDIYFSVGNVIKKTPKNNYNPETIVTGLSMQPFASINSFAISNDFIYRIENSNNVGRIYRSSIDGTNTVTIYTATTEIYNLKLKNDKLYWITSASFANNLIQSNIDGTNLQTIQTIPGRINSYEIYCGILYYSHERLDFTNALMAVNLNGSNLQTLRELPEGINFSIYDPKNIQPVCVNTIVSPNASNQYILPDYTGTIALNNVNCSSEISLTQFPSPGTVITQNTDVQITILDNEGNQINECVFNAVPETLSVNNNEFNAIGLMLFPNPTSSSVTIKGNTNFDSISIYDIYGKKLKTVSITNSNEYILDVTDLASGIYFVECQLGDNKLYQKLFKD